MLKIFNLRIRTDNEGNAWVPFSNQEFEVWVGETKIATGYTLEQWDDNNFSITCGGKTITGNVFCENLETFIKYRVAKFLAEGK